MTLEEMRALVAVHGSHRAAAKAIGMAWSTFWDLTRRLESRAPKTATIALVKLNVARPKRGKVTRFIFTSAQDGTEIHEGFLTNLETYAEYLGAELCIGGYTYNKSLFEDHSNTRAEFHERVKPYLCNAQINVGDKLLFCGEINTRPTIVNPLSGFETYTRNMWGVFPHPRICLQSVATMFNEPAKQIMTTGSVTKPNYIPLNVGFKAEFHHVVGALLVELDSAGDIFCRHLIADKAGGFQDLDHHVDADGITCGHSVAAITWGDIHFENIDPVVQRACWEPDVGILDTLMPSHQFFHDTIDFNARNHHNIHDPYHRFDRWQRGLDDVEADMRRAGEFLVKQERPWCRNVVVESNHDLAFRRWLKEADYRTDPKNAVFFLDCQKRVYDALKEESDTFSIFEDTMRRYGALKRTTFLRETDSFMICMKGKNGIECALHGHRGANGAKGHFKQFAKMGPKANVAHTHSPGIYEGIYCAGTSSKLDLGYNRGGLSSWAHSHIITYPNGKRIILTMQGEKWRA